MVSTVMTFPPKLVIETRNQVCNIISEMKLRSLKLSKNTSSGTIDPTIASTSSSEQNIIPVTSEEALQPYSRIPIDEPNPTNNFKYLHYLNM